ncbi:MAG: hypothetical protein KAG28_01650 [Cocleimonas sp.]|nr:hypothetical protein [Cocleimonas sp.]
MKNQYWLLVGVVVATLSFSQAFAMGETYDPYENYYSQYYGMTADVSVSLMDSETITDDAVENKATEAALDMTPLNYFNW